jgi:hypothetical protein
LKNSRLETTIAMKSSLAINWRGQKRFGNPPKKRKNPREL